MKATDTKDPEYFHQVVDCQYACPAHTPVPEYIRLIAEGRYSDAYMVNWESNVFPGVLGRTCDRPCEPACRRGRLKSNSSANAKSNQTSSKELIDKKAAYEEPVAICRLKRVAADYKGDIRARLPAIPKQPQGKRIALIGAGPASLTVARDLAPLGYTLDLYDAQHKAGGFMRSQIPAFRLPEEVLDEEVNYILDMGISTHFTSYVKSLQAILQQRYDVVFVGTGAPRGKELNLPGREEGKANIHIGIDWLSSVAFEHTKRIGKRVIVLGGGNTAMDCCRTARRLGGEQVQVVVRSPFYEMKASAWEKDDALAEDIPILDNHVPQAFIIKDGKLTGMQFDRVEAVYDKQGKRSLHSTGEAPVIIACDDVLMAIGQETAFPWIERDIGIDFDEWGAPIVNPDTFQSTLQHVFFGGDAAFGPKNIITAVAHGHQAAISIDLFCRGESVANRPPPRTNLVSQKMGVHEWSYPSDVSNDVRYQVPHAKKEVALKDRLLEVELGFKTDVGFKEAMRCLNCDVQTVFTANRCIECDACVDICPTDCITFTRNDEENVLREKLSAKAENLDQSLYVSADLPTQRVLVKDENVCLHCGLCAERCPTTAWDMQKFLYSVSKASQIDVLALDG